MRRLPLALAIVLLLPACRAGYILKQYRGQRKIQNEMRPIVDVLSDPAVGEAAKAKLRWVLRAREFGIQKVGLHETDNYTWFYDTGGKPVAFNVTACRTYAFKEKRWWFPIVGSVPYLGFFAKEDAVEEKKSLDEDGWDTNLSEVAAYNTLGWYTDPVFSPMLRNEEGQLAATILHEMTHGTLYLAGQSDFDETLAEWVGNEASRELMTEAYGADSPQARRFAEDLEDEARFNAFLESVRADLDALYKQEIPREEKVARREEVFSGARERFGAEAAKYHLAAYTGFLKRELNNALILSFGRYHARTDLFDRAFVAHDRDLRATVAWFKTLEGEKEAQKAMEAWLSARGSLDAPSGGR